MKRIIIFLIVIVLAYLLFFSVDNYVDSSLVNGDDSYIGLFFLIVAFISSFFGKKKYRTLFTNLIYRGSRKSIKE